MYCHYQNDSCIKMGSDESHVSVSLIVGDKVTTQDSVHRPQLLKGKEKRSRLEPRSFCLPAKRLTARPNRLTPDYSYTHAPYVVAWLRIKLQIGARLYGVHRTYAETEALTRGTSHVTSKQRCKCTTSVDNSKRCV